MKKKRIELYSCITDRNGNINNIFIYRLRITERVTVDLVVRFYSCYDSTEDPTKIIRKTIDTAGDQMIFFFGRSSI